MSDCDGAYSVAEHYMGQVEKQKKRIAELEEENDLFRMVDAGDKMDMAEMQSIQDRQAKRIKELEAVNENLRQDIDSKFPMIAKVNKKMSAENAQLRNRIEELEAEVAGLREAASRALRAICFTRDYVGEQLLPPIEGWEWYDAGQIISKLIPGDKWVEQFQIRTALSALHDNAQDVSEREEG